MVLFRKIHSTNKKLTNSKLFSFVLFMFFALLIGAAVYIFLPEDKNILDSIPAELNFFDQDKKIKTLDPKYEQYDIQLKEIFNLAEEKPRMAIKKLEEIKDLPELLENRKNYVLMTLYSKVKEPALAFISANKITKDYLPKHVLYKKAMMAKDIGLEAIVIEDLLFLTNKYSTEAKFEYELAKSYSRQSLKEDAIKHFSSIQEAFPGSDYALGADYYLANLSSDSNVTKAKLAHYLNKSPDGNLANLAAKQLLANTDPSDIEIKKLSNHIAISYHKQGDNKKALEYFNPDLDRPELFLQDYAETLAALGFKSKAREALVKYLPRVNSKEKASKLIEYLVELSSKQQAIANLRLLKDTVLENIKDKVIWEIAKKTHANEDYLAIYSEYPNSFYAAESMAKVFWKEVKRKNYTKAQSLASKHWDAYPYAKSHPYVAFWSAKIFLEQGDKAQAYDRLNKIISLHPHDYYSYRAKQIIAEDKSKWYNMPSANRFVAFPNWNWPKVMNDQEIAAEFGADTLELTKINQYAYLLENIDEKKLGKKFKMFLEAQSGNYIQAIRTAFFALGNEAKPNHEDILFQYAYPLAYADLIFDRAGKNQKVDPMLVHSLIRQESFYQKDIVSKVGAVGLMQVMPYTAKSLARLLNMRRLRTYDLMQPETNITLGVKYMEEVFGEFDNNMINAIASYNAGPTAVKRWIKRNSFDDPDMYIESIPYNETRDYVKKVLNNYWIYRELYS